MTKKILGIITDRTETFTKFNILFIKKFINEIDEFYIFTTEEAYNTFFYNLLDFPHKKVFFNKNDYYPNKLGMCFYLYTIYLCDHTEENSIIYITGDGEFLIQNPFKWIEKYENNFENYDIINCIHNHHGTNLCFDIGAFFKNNNNSKLFFEKLLYTLNNIPEDLLLVQNGQSIKNIKSIYCLNKWLILQDIFWSIYVNCDSLNFLSKIAKIKFFKNKFHWAGNSASIVSWLSTLYDSFFLKEECVVNLLGRFKYVIPDECYEYYFNNYDEKKIISKDDFVEKYKNIDNQKLLKISNHYHLIHTNKFKK